MVLEGGDVRLHSSEEHVRMGGRVREREGRGRTVQGRMGAGVRERGERRDCAGEDRRGMREGRGRTVQGKMGGGERWERQDCAVGDGSRGERQGCAGGDGSRGERRRVAGLSPGFLVLLRWRKVTAMMAWEEDGHLHCGHINVEMLLILPSGHIK